MRITNGAAIETAAAGSTYPFYGQYQSGIITPPPPSRQPFSTYAAFNVTAANRSELTDLFRTLTEQVAFLAAGGTAPSAPAGSPPPDNGIVGPEIQPDGLTATVSVGASLFDGRYGLASLKPVQLVTMEPFAHDDLDPSISDGDLLIQLCADHNDTAGPRTGGYLHRHQRRPGAPLDRQRFHEPAAPGRYRAGLVRFQGRHRTARLHEHRAE